VHLLRRWVRRPGFTTGAALILALGIGVTAAVFSVVNAVLFRPLPWPEADRLVAIYAVIPERRSEPSATATWNSMCDGRSAGAGPPRVSSIRSWRFENSFQLPASSSVETQVSICYLTMSEHEENG